MNPETAKTLKDTIKSVEWVNKENKRIQPVLKDTSGKLEAAIEDESQPMIELYRPQLEKVVADVENCMSGVEGSLALIGHLKKDEEFVATRFAELEKLTQTVASIQTQLTKQLTQARDLDKRAAKALDTLVGGQDEAVREFAVVKDAFNDLKKAVDSIEKEAVKLENEAKQAYAARNQKALTDARVKLIEFLKYRSGITLVRNNVNEFLKKYKDSGFITEATWLLDDLPRMEDVLKQVDQTVKDLITLGQVASIDVAKAVKVLKLDPKVQPKLAKVLNGPESGYEKGLEVLAKEHDATSKAWMALLRREKVIPA